MRPIYIRLLQFHPAGFRERFALEMLDIYDECGQPSALVLDAALSLLRQWGFREPIRRSPIATPPAGSPAFYMTDGDTPRPGPLITGGLLAVLFFAAISFLIAHGGMAPRLILGSFHPSRSHLLPVATHAKPQDLTTETRMRAYPDQQPMSAYFRRMPILQALDTDKDGVISAAEIENAPAALAKLDANHDGHLDAEECGARGVKGFMRIHPVIAALDSNHDLIVSADEIRNAAAALLALDRNKDGSLTELELRPDDLHATVISVMATLDADGDHRLSARELTGPIAKKFESALANADRNHDGWITEDELAAELLRLGPIRQ